MYSDVVKLCCRIAFQMAYIILMSDVTNPKKMPDPLIVPKKTDYIYYLTLPNEHWGDRKFDSTKDLLSVIRKTDQML